MADSNDVLVYSKVEGGRLKVDGEPFGLRPIVERVSSMVAVAAHAKGVEFITSVDSDLPPVVCGDGHRLRQILTNLTTNAVKFTAQGEVAVEVSGTPLGDGRVLLRFKVRDTGIGIDPASLDRIFDSFTQQDS